MEEWTKYVLDNVEYDKVLSYCATNLAKTIVSTRSAMTKEQNQLATALLCDMENYVALLAALNERVNGKTKTKTAVVA